MKTRLLLSAGLALAALARSSQANFLEVTFPTGSALIPDADLAGRADSRTLSGIDGSLLDVDVRLRLRGTGTDGGWNGDVYVSLSHASGFSVLLNRPGRGSGSDFGSSSNGFDLAFDDTATNGDVHNAPDGESPLTGVWQPDGRKLVPTAAATDFDAAPRSGLLDAFNGLAVSGDWTLLVVDASSGGQLQLEEWGLRLTYQPASAPEPPPSVPDPSTPLGFLGVAIAGILAIHKRAPMPTSRASLLPPQ